VDPSKLRLALARHMNPGAEGAELEALSKQQDDPAVFWCFLLQCLGACQVCSMAWFIREHSQACKACMQYALFPSKLLESYQEVTPLHCCQCTYPPPTVHPPHHVLFDRPCYVPSSL
jgi:hypothetical protein